MIMIKRSLAIAVVLLLVASASVFAAEIEYDGEFHVRFETEKEYAGQLKFGNIQRSLNLLKLNVAIRESDQWSIKLENAIRSNAQGYLSLGIPEYAAHFDMDVVDVDIWGGNYDLGADAVLSDPAQLLIFGSQGDSALYQLDPTYETSNPKLRTTFKNLNLFNAIAQIHMLRTGTNGLTNFELYGDHDIESYNVGALLRHATFNLDTINNSTTAVVFARTEMGNYQLGASLGNRFGKSVDGNALSFGLTASTDYSDALHLQAGYVQRGANFLQHTDHNASDRDYQLWRFGGLGKGSIIELVATYRGEGDRDGAIAAYVNEDLFEDRTINNFIDPLKAAKFPSLSAQGIVRVLSDESDKAENQIVVRAGFPIAGKLWGAAELGLLMDKDGTGMVGGVFGDDMVSRLAASVLYELSSDWDARFSLDILTAHASTNGSETEAIASVSREAGDMTTTFGFIHASSSDEDKAALQLFGEVKIEF